MTAARATAWERLDEDAGEREWDALALRAGDASVFQSWRWGEYRRRAGWTPERWLARIGGEPVALAQLLVKPLPLGARIIWVPGGPLFRFPRGDADSLAEAVAALTARLHATTRAAY